MILTLVVLASLGVLAILAVMAFARRERDFTKVTIPAVEQPFPPAPQMVGLSKTIEEAVADEAAKKLAADIEYDLFYGTRPPPPKPPGAMRAPKKKVSRVGKARRRGSRAKR